MAAEAAEKRQIMKTYQKLVAGGLIVALSAGCTFAYAGNRADAAEKELPVVGVNREAGIAVTKTQSGLEAEKKELVYVFADANGEKKQVVVTDTLTNPDGLKSFPDISSLQDIVNIKGDESFVQNGSSLIWQADGNDICYRGTTAAEAPVGVRVTYFLDGRELTAQELSGKSGKVTIRFDYYNHQTGTAGGGQQEVAVPFAMVTAVLFDEEKFENVEVTHGKLIRQGNLCAAVLVGMPGVAESLGLSEDYSMDYAEITADMVDFSLTNTFTVATNSPFSEISLNGDADLDSLSDAFTKLGDATEELADGALRLKDGAKELSEGARELWNGAGALAQGAGTLSDNMQVLAEGAEELKTGAKALAGGAEGFADGLDSAKSGSAALAAGTAALKSGTEELSEGIEAAAAGAGALAAGSGELKMGAEQVQTGAESLNAGLKKLGAGAEALNQGVDAAWASLDATIAYNQQVLDGLTAFAAAYGAKLDAETAAALQTMVGTLQQTIAAQQQIADSMTGDGALKSGVKTVAVGAVQLAEGAETLEAGSAALSKGAQTLDAGLGELVGKLPQLKEGFGKLAEGIDRADAGAAELDAGLAQLQAAGGQLKDGADGLYVGAGTLSDGAAALAGGSTALKEGAAELDGGAKKLSNGAAELADGAEMLADGMKEYSEEGIGRLLGALEDADLKNVYERFDAMLDAASEYRSFTGASGEMDGSVTFLIRTESIGK